MKFVLFLDIDGVLNTKTTVAHTLDGYTGIDDARVEVLAKAIEKYGGGEIVLSSDWKDMDQKDEDYGYLVSKLAKQGVKLSGKTEDHWHDRGEGILLRPLSLNYN
ncbi:MAG: HAD domain-containing protein [Firmicutes bacterium]|nr:HAD domain-containing protein [Bacillota bacterium]